MRRVYFICLMAMTLSYASQAQDVLAVEPGVGTLNAAIAANGGSKIYQLKAGGYYGLDGIIQNDGFHLQIIGEEPTDGGRPATLQTGSDGTGAVFGQMFNAIGNLTLKNIFFVNADLNSQTANNFIVQNANNGRTVVDNCVLHPAAIVTVVMNVGNNSKVYFTNNQAFNHGHQLNPNDGWFFHFGNAPMSESGRSGLDTLYVENNTFIGVGMCLFETGFNKFTDNNFVKFNHNTFALTKSQIDWSIFENEYYWTNNLMFDAQTQAYMTAWQPMPGGDASKPKPNLIYADTIPGESLPSVRTNYVQYNGHFRAQGFYDLIDEANVFANANSLPNAYLFPLVWPEDTTNSRESLMFRSPDFPKFKYGNTITDVDPMWFDTKIYTNEAQMILWTRPANFVHGMGQDPANYDDLADFNWHWENDDYSKDSPWPLFNGQFTNEQYLSGAIEENVPLGDLNWWPEAMTAWMAKKSEIEAHIKAGNTGKINIGFAGVTAPCSGEDCETSVLSSADFKANFKVYPNPVTDFINIDTKHENYSVDIIDINGKLMLSAKNASRINMESLGRGLYIMKVTTKDKTYSTRIIR